MRASVPLPGRRARRAPRWNAMKQGSKRRGTRRFPRLRQGSTPSGPAWAGYAGWRAGEGAEGPRPRRRRARNPCPTRGGWRRAGRGIPGRDQERGAPVRFGPAKGRLRRGEEAFRLRARACRFVGGRRGGHEMDGWIEEPGGARGSEAPAEEHELEAPRNGVGRLVRKRRLVGHAAFRPGAGEEGEELGPAAGGVEEPQPEVVPA